MLTDWLELPGAESFFRRAGELAGADLLELGTTGDAEAIKDTAVTQPLVVAMSLFVAQHLGAVPEPGAPLNSDVVITGHSVGELTAAALAGVLSVEDAITLTAARGRAMAAACAQTPTGMSAVLGGDPDDVVAAIEAAGLTAANRNGAGQIVAAGALDALDKLAAEPPAGARVRPLPVAGAFHTSYMAPAEDALGGYVGSLEPLDPRPILLSNADGSSVGTGADVVTRLVRQVTLPVRWDLCLRTCADLGVSAALELAPAGPLTGIAKRELPGVELLAIKSPDDIQQARTLIDSRPQHGQGEYTPEFRVLVTPAKGVFTRAGGVEEGSALAAGTQVGTIRTNRDEHRIVVAKAGVLAEWLRHDGDIVAAGLPVARIQNGVDY
jgi:[acyl-carrier-protein] S-malonyltransferase